MDVTQEMLEKGKNTASYKKRNMIFVKGNAREMPFLSESFDVVMSRPAFHHFINPKEIFAEMTRVLKKRQTRAYGYGSKR